jgi:hypothetical protein
VGELIVSKTLAESVEFSISDDTCVLDPEEDAELSKRITENKMPLLKFFVVSTTVAFRHSTPCALQVLLDPVTLAANQNQSKPKPSTAPAALAAPTQPTPANAALPKDLLWVVEQVPGLVVSGDATELLALGHFPSYNVPFWREIYDISGYKQQLAARRPNGTALGELSGLDWQLAPRAKIFRRDAGKVTDMESFLGVMRSNDYKNDPYAGGSPWNAICSRGDLAGSPDGCLDGKASMASLWAQRKALAINGPTRGAAYGGPLPPFAWTQFPDTPHLGLPPVYDFAFEVRAARRSGRPARARARPFSRADARPPAPQEMRPTWA